MAGHTCGTAKKWASFRATPATQQIITRKHMMFIAQVFMLQLGFNSTEGKKITSASAKFQQSNIWCNTRCGCGAGNPKAEC